MFEILKLSKDTDGSIWNKAYNYYENNKRVFDRYTSLTEYNKGTLHFLQNSNDNFSFIILENDEVIGSFITYIESYEHNILGINTGISNNKTNDLLLKLIIKTAAANYHETSSILYYINKHDNYYASHAQLKKIWVSTLCMLGKNDFDLIGMIQMEKEIEAGKPNLKIAALDMIPDNKLKEYVSLYLECTNDIPNDEPEKQYTDEIAKEFAEKEKKNRTDGDKRFRFVIYNELNKIVAFSIVRMYKDDQKHPYQSMTGVKSEYRGNGLSKWLKSVMYQKLFKEYPDIDGITGSMLFNNVYIQKINKLFGFKIISTQIKYSIDKEYLDDLICK